MKHITLRGIALIACLLAIGSEDLKAQAPPGTGILRCSVVWNGNYKFYDGVSNDPELVGRCLRMRGRYRGYVIMCPPSYAIVFVNPRTKEFSTVSNCTFDCAYQFVCGRRQNVYDLCLSSCKTINIVENNLDIDRCEIQCLDGRLGRFTVAGRGPNRTLIEVNRLLRGSFCRVSCYLSNDVSNTCFVESEPYKRDFRYDQVGLTAGGIACIKGRKTCRLDGPLTKKWYELNFGDKMAARSVIADYLTARGYADAGSITEAEFCALQNLTGVEPFLP